MMIFPEPPKVPQSPRPRPDQTTLVLLTIHSNATPDTTSFQVSSAFAVPFSTKPPELKTHAKKVCHECSPGTTRNHPEPAEPCIAFANLLDTPRTTYITKTVRYTESFRKIRYNNSVTCHPGRFDKRLISLPVKTGWTGVLNPSRMLGGGLRWHEVVENRRDALFGAHGRSGEKVDGWERVSPRANGWSRNAHAAPSLNPGSTACHHLQLRRRERPYYNPAHCYYLRRQTREEVRHSARPDRLRLGVQYHFSANCACPTVI
jgi:hypothetical protein